MRIVWLVILCVVVGQIQIFAQSQAAALEPCAANLRIETTPDFPDFGELVTAEALFDGGKRQTETAQLRIVWQVVDATLLGGQGTAKLQFKQVRKNAGKPFIVGVEISSESADCAPIKTAILHNENARALGETVDEFGKLWLGDEKTRLDNLVVQAANRPGAQILILMCAPRKLGANYLDMRVKRAFAHLVNQRKMEPEEVLFGTSVCAAEKTTFWIVPAGAKLPALSADNKLIEGTSLTAALPKPAKN